MQLELRRSDVADLDALFQIQLDPEANYWAAFTSKESAERATYIAKFTRLLADPTVNQLTILLDGVIVGSVAKFVMQGDTEITYWIDRAYWGRGIATAALQGLLSQETTRPIFGRVAFDNLASQRILEKCGFQRVGADRGFAFARGVEIEEFIYELQS